MISDTVNNKVNKQKSTTPKKSTEKTSEITKNNVATNKKNVDIGLRIPGSNWQKFKNLATEASSEQATSDTQIKKKKLHSHSSKNHNNDHTHSFNDIIKQTVMANKTVNEKINKVCTELTRCIAMDCEMVGIGDGQDSMIARVSIVNRDGFCVYDKYVKPTEAVQDYRTAVSGIRPHHLENGEDFKTVQKEISEILRGRILVGHALHNDLDVLYLSHPKRFQRDTSRYKFFRRVTKGNTPSLKKLAAELLGIDIQSGEHNSIEDARAAMQLYQLFRKKWETDIRNKR